MLKKEVKKYTRLGIEFGKVEQELNRITSPIGIKAFGLQEKLQKIVDKRGEIENKWQQRYFKTK